MILVPSLAGAAAFSDVGEDSSKYYAAVEYLTGKGIISGYEDGTFKPDNKINRAEALKIVLLSAGIEGQSEQEINFPDVSDGDWFSGYVKKAVETGLVEGYEDGTFKPANNINIAESLKIILLAFEEDMDAPPSKAPYPDVDSKDWYAIYVDHAKSKQIIECYDDGLLHADNDITRGEFAEIIYRLLYMEENNLQVFPLSTNWPEYNDAQNDFSLKHPSDWKIIKAGNQVIFWKRDDANEQLSWARVFPNSATIVIAVDENEAGTSLKEYVDLLEYDSSSSKEISELNGFPFTNISIAGQGINDYFFELPDGKILAAYTQVGDGKNQPLLLEKIRYIVGCIRYYTGDESGSTSIDMDREVFLSEVRKKILVEGQGQSILDMFDDELLIDTDTIGIGTGPVDYYYSDEYNITLKLERDSDTVLAINDGNNTAF